MNPDLLILSATDIEVSSFLVQYPGDLKRSIQSGHRLYSGHIGQKNYDLLITGPGVFNAVLAFTAYLEQLASNLNPSLVVQIGIAGVFKETGLSVGDLAIATSDRYLHTGVESNCIKNGPLPFELIQEAPLSCKGMYPFHETQVDHLFQALCRRAKSQGIEIGKGPFITVSTITSSSETADQIYKRFSSIMEAMEGAASAHVATVYDIPMIEVRAASNFAGDRNKSNWNFDLAIEQLGWACKTLFDDD